MSGGTLIALAADEIVMDPNAVLEPVDPQLKELPAASIMTVLERKEPKDIDDETLILADVARKALRQLEDTVRDLLAARMPEEQATVLARRLASGTWTHDYAITAEEAKALGLPVSTEMPAEIYDFNAHHEPLAFKLPDRAWGRRWVAVLDTRDAVPRDGDTPRRARSEVEVAARSLVVLRRAGGAKRIWHEFRSAVESAVRRLQ